LWSWQREQATVRPRKAFVVVSMRSSIVSSMLSKRLPMVMKPRAARRASSGLMSGSLSAASCSMTKRS
jgi:hypothetical protein